jgi:dihydrofolate synthase/folylpolyglutamate synthase
VNVTPSAAGIQAWLDTAPNSERSGDFRAIRPERMRAFLARLPAPPAPCTVAGTKGKGSTVRLIEAALGANGLATVAFTSPHVVSVLERWRIDGRSADPAVLAPLCEQVERSEDASGLRLSWFERTFAVACLLAHQRPCAFICEVGLGGRLDATNALDAAVAVLTHVSHDHREVLGATTWHIAHEKLAISRAGRPLVIAPQEAATALAVWHRLPPGREVRWAQRPRPPIALALAGAHQQDNAATALLAARLYRPGIDLGRALAGMAEATLVARCQQVGRVLVDGAHNGPSLAATLAVAQERFGTDWTLVLGTAQDKEIEAMLAAVPAGVAVLRCGYAHARSRGEQLWPEAARRLPWFADVDQALAATAGNVCVSGSLYLAGEALSALGQQGEERNLALQG